MEICRDGDDEDDNDGGDDAEDDEDKVDVSELLLVVDAVVSGWPQSL